MSFEEKAFALEDARMAKKQDWYWRSLFHMISRSSKLILGFEYYESLWYLPSILLMR